MIKIIKSYLFSSLSFLTIFYQILHVIIITSLLKLVTFLTAQSEEVKNREMLKQYSSTNRKFLSSAATLLDAVRNGRSNCTLIFSKFFEALPVINHNKHKYH